MIDKTQCVTRQELMQETGLCNTTITKYMRDVLDYINRRLKQARENSNNARRKGKSVYDKKLAVHKNARYDWRVSIRGSYGWIVVRVGTQDEMEPWAEMLMRNGIEARASRNEWR